MPCCWEAHLRAVPLRPWAVSPSRWPGAQEVGPEQSWPSLACLDSAVWCGSGGTFPGHRGLRDPWLLSHPAAQRGPNPLLLSPRSARGRREARNAVWEPQPAAWKGPGGGTLSRLRLLPAVLGWGPSPEGLWWGRSHSGCGRALACTGVLGLCVHPACGPPGRPVPGSKVQRVRARPSPPEHPHSCAHRLRDSWTQLGPWGGHSQREQGSWGWSATNGLRPWEGT